MKGKFEGYSNYLLARSKGAELLGILEQTPGLVGCVPQESLVMRAPHSARSTACKNIQAVSDI